MHNNDYFIMQWKKQNLLISAGFSEVQLLLWISGYCLLAVAKYKLKVLSHMQ